MKNIFRKAAERVSHWVGTPWAFALAVAGITVWAALGPGYKFSDTWQLIINTTTTIITFLMVFLIQNTQNRNARALHLKLDELIRATKGARNELIDLEEMSDEKLEEIHREFWDTHQRTTEMIEHINNLKLNRKKRKRPPPPERQI